MTGSIPRLLGYVTVGAGAAAAGYVGLVTGACPLDLGIGRRVRPLGPQQPDMAAPRELVFDVIAEPFWAEPHARWPTSCGCWKPAATWCWRPTSPPPGGGWAWLPSRWRRSASPDPSGSTSGWSAARSPTWWRRSCSPSSRSPSGPRRRGRALRHRPQGQPAARHHPGPPGGRGRRVTDRDLVTHRLAADQAQRATIERVLNLHADRCPVARTVGGCVAISTSLDLQPVEAAS